MNLDSIKNSGYRLGLEAELNVQKRGLDDYIKEGKYQSALQCANNIIELLTELTKLHPGKR
jgi:hypothetical protein